MEELAPTKEEKIKGYDKYEIENACDTLLKAEMIKQDAKMMAAIKPYLDKKAKAAQAVAKVNPKEGLDSLRKVAAEKSKEY